MPDDPIHALLWRRFDRYVIDKGALRPAPDAKLQSYDPWERFHEVRGRYRAVETTWGEFAELTRRLQQPALQPFQPSPAGQQEILAWCHRYGLLGILPGQAVKIDLPPVYERSTASAHRESFDRLRVRRTYGRVAGHWLGTRMAEVDFDWYGSAWTPGQLAPLKEGEKFHTVWWDWIDFEWKSEETATALQRYFPQPIRNLQYPLPLSEEFWPVYQEPLWEWLRTAFTFTKAVEFISNYATQRFNNLPAPPDDELQNINKALWLLNSLADAEASVFEFGNCVLNQQRSSASLLSAMAKMFFLDILAGRRLLRCATCGRFFVTNAVGRARYCSVRCRNTNQTRRYRAARTVN